MSLDAHSYGSPGGVAGLTPRLANALGEFDVTTNPTLNMVETFLDEVSGMLNVLLAEQGFATPVTQADCRMVLDLFANQEAAAICEGVRGSGRFGPNVGKGTPKGRFAIIGDDAAKFIEAYAAGFERLGAARIQGRLDGLAYRATDRAGNAVPPLTQRKSFGDDRFRKDWDS